MSGNTVALQKESGTLDLELHTAAHAFAQALAESAVFQAFDQAAERLGQDEIAQNAIQAFQNKQQSPQMLLQLNAVGPEERAELEHLRKAFLDQPSVIGYVEAQEKLATLCQAAGNLLSERIGLSFTACCSSGCC